MPKLLKILSFCILFLPFSSFCGEDSTYNFSWLDPDKEVYVLQNRKYRKVKNFHVGLGYGTTTSGPFVDANSIQFRGGYFFQEEWGFEVVYAKNSNSTNSNYDAVRNIGSAGTTPFVVEVQGYTAGLLLWSPFYTKINTFNKILYLDWIFGIGYASLDEENNYDEVGSNILGTTTKKTGTHTGLIWEAGLQLYLNESSALRLDLTTVHFSVDAPSSNLGTAGTASQSNWDVSLSYTFRL